MKDKKIPIPPPWFGKKEILTLYEDKNSGKIHLYIFLGVDLYIRRRRIVLLVTVANGDGPAADFITLIPTVCVSVASHVNINAESIVTGELVGCAGRHG